MFDDIYEGSKQKRKTSHYGHDDNSYNKYANDSYGGEGYDHYNPLLNLAKKILRNKVLLAALVFTLLVIGALGVWVIIKLLPYLGQVVSMAEKQGFKGIMDTIMPLIQKFGNAAGK
jgi:hypothetical protein